MNGEDQETKVSSNERILIHEAYETLEKHQVTPHNICVFLLALLGIYNVEPIDFKNGEEVQEFSLDEVSGRKLHKHFDLFYRNRLSS